MKKLHKVHTVHKDHQVNHVYIGYEHQLSEEKVTYYNEFNRNRRRNRFNPLYLLSALLGFERRIATPLEVATETWIRARYELLSAKLEAERAQASVQMYEERLRRLEADICSLKQLDAMLVNGKLSESSFDPVKFSPEALKDTTVARPEESGETNGDDWKNWQSKSSNGKLTARLIREIQTR